MKQLSGVLLMLVLTGPFVLSKPHSSTIPIIPSFKRPNSAGKPRELNILHGESLHIYLFCDLENLNTEKVWCKEELKACLPQTHPVIFSEPEWKVLTMASNKKVKLGDSRKGCVSVHMTNVEVEDSGLYWFGLLHGRKIDYLSPIKMVVHKVTGRNFMVYPTTSKTLLLRKHNFFSTSVLSISVPSTTNSLATFRTPSFESPSKAEWRPVEVTVIRGEPLSMVGFCGQQHLKKKKIWCKGELCDPKAPGQLLGPGWKNLTTDPNQRIIIRDSTNGCTSLSMTDLQLEDSGIYWFGFLDGWNIIPFKKLTVIVQEEQKNHGNVTITKENNPSIYHVALAVGSSMAGILIIAFISILILMMFTKSNVRDA
ncbi:uncharacterized protein LOC143835974 isoform X2 [Paroedura picta]|uniref:uncharacterized protein LOC143835974 isoform X2 n=1 Tax=Paroedura picta TaxID=143630 RepID=UPI004056E086